MINNLHLHVVYSADLNFQVFTAWILLAESSFLAYCKRLSLTFCFLFPLSRIYGICIPAAWLNIRTFSRVSKLFGPCWRHSSSLVVEQEWHPVVTEPGPTFMSRSFCFLHFINPLPTFWRQKCFHAWAPRPKSYLWTWKTETRELRLKGFLSVIFFSSHIFWEHKQSTTAMRHL